MSFQKLGDLFEVWPLQKPFLDPPMAPTNVPPNSCSFSNFIFDHFVLENLKSYCFFEKKTLKYGG